MAPTAHLADQRKSHELEMCKLRVECQKEKIDELTKERDYLKEQLASGKSHNTTFIIIVQFSFIMRFKLCVSVYHVMQAVSLIYVFLSILTALKRVDKGSSQTSPLSSKLSSDISVDSSSDTMSDSSSTSSSERDTKKKRTKKKGKGEKYGKKSKKMETKTRQRG